jgi:quercetin dioxygenase-like cupin family protein
MRIPSGLHSRSILLMVGLTGAAILGIEGIASAGPKDVKTTPVLTTDSPELKWGPADIIPPGAQGALLVGGDDWHIVRVKFPPHYLVPPHSHPDGEEVWLIGGTVVFGFGDKVDKTLPPLKPGAFFALAGGGKHWVWTGDEGGVIDVLETVPGGITYVNPADDPRPKK